MSQHHDEWHLKRRTQILKAHPEVKELMVNNIWTGILAILITTGYIVGSVWASTQAWHIQALLAYFVFCTIANSLGVLMHDIYHNLAFKSDFNTRLLLTFMNVVNLAETNVVVRALHRSHHAHLENRGRNPEHPSQEYLDSTLEHIREHPATKFLMLIPFYEVLVDAILLPLIFPVQDPLPGAVDKEDSETFEIVAARINHEERHWTTAANAWKLVVELFLFINFGIGPLALRVMAESYLYAHVLVGARGLGEHVAVSDEARTRKQLTFSRYGYINYLTFNVAHHVEHHDIPNIPWNHLPRLHSMAPEFYKDLVEQEDWILLWWRWLKSDPLVSRRNYMQYIRTKKDKAN